MSCELREQCPIPGDDGVKAIFKRRYCEKNFCDCARYRVARHPQVEMIPVWLLPNMEKEAREYLNALQTPA